MSQYRQKEVEAIKASEGLSHPIFDGDRKKIKNLEKQLAEAREENSRLKTDVIHDLESMYPYDEDKHTIKDIRDLINKLKEKQK